MSTRLSRRSTGSVLVCGTLVLCPNAGADDYRLHPSPTFTTGTAHVRTEYPAAHDSKVCQTYLANLRYFARRNTAMSCERPVAPRLMKVIQAVEWEDIDPGANAVLLSAVMARASYGSDKGQKALDYRTDEIRKGVRVFRRAKMAISGTFDNGRHGPKDEAEAFQIVQYGINVLDPNNPAELWRCTPQRGGPEKDYSSYLKLYIASPDLEELRGELSNYMGGGPTGGHLRTIRDNLYVEFVATNGNSILMQLRTAFPIGLESVCLYLFKQSQ